MSENYTPRLKQKYIDEIAPALMKKFGYKSVMQIPKLDKITVNVGCGEARDNSKVLDSADIDRDLVELGDQITVNVGCGEARDNSKVLDSVVNDLAIITGQKPVITRARKSIANFKLREDMPIGAKVTLRQDKMWEFLDRFFNIALPRVRDFRGIQNGGFDGRGNFAMGIKEQLIFPEIEYDKIDKIRGMDIVFTTTAETDEEARELLELLGAPFAR